MSKPLVTLLLILGIIVSTTVVLYVIMQTGDEVTTILPEAPQPVLVRAKPVTLQLVTHSIKVFGTVVPLRRSLISAEVEGEIAFLSPRTELGSAVQKGEELARLKETMFRLELEKQRALLQRQKALYQAEVLAAKRENELLTIAREKLELAQADFARKERLWKRGILSEQEYEATKQRLEVAKAELQRAKQAVEKMETGSIQVLQADIAAAKAAVALAEERLRNTVIRAPFEGIITEKLVDLGQQIRAREHVFTIIDLSQVKILTHVPSDEIGLVTAGQQVLVSVDTYPEKEFAGQVAHIGKAGDSRNRMFPLEIVVKNTEDSFQLLPGMFARAHIVVNHFPAAILVPDELLQRSGEQHFVYLADETRTRAVKRQVTPGLHLEQGYIIQEGLQPGDMLITEGYDLLLEDTPITLQDLQATAPRD